MNPNETGELMDMIRFVRDEFHMTILLIEHDMKLVSGICERLTVLNFGEVLSHGATSDVLNDLRGSSPLILENRRKRIMAMLEIKDLEVYYGVIQAIKGISFEVNQGEVIALIGANGAGKTTTLHTITGLISPKKGSVVFEGKDITKVPAHRIVSMGMPMCRRGAAYLRSSACMRT